MKVLLLSLLYISTFATAITQVDKPRILVLTDIENEPDDAQSLVRFLTYANQFEIEGIVATTSTWMRKEVADWRIHEIVDAYGMVRDNLAKHEEGYPSHQFLKERIKKGRSVFGMQGVGPGKDSEGSDWIIEMADKVDDRPLWITVWGGANCLAQALWKVRSERNNEELNEFISKLRVYTISDQDDSGPWIRRTFPDLFYICTPGIQEDGGGGYHYATWSGISGDKFHGRFLGPDFSIVDNPWLDEHIRNDHGPLGAEYPQTEYLMEGDSPSFMYLIPNGLGSPEFPNFGSWGGRYEHYIPKTERWFYYPESNPLWTNAIDEIFSNHTNHHHTSNHATIWRWREAYQNDFAARIDWCILDYDEANHPPKCERETLRVINAKPGSKVNLEALDWMDPDGDELSYDWIYYSEVGNGHENLNLINKGNKISTVEIPKLNKRQELHFICAVTDNGSPALTRYERLIVKTPPR